MQWKSFWKGFGILVVAPILVLIAFAGVAYLSNQPKPGAILQTEVSPAIVFPWNQTAYIYRFDGSALEKTEPRPVDLVFLIDVSGSMRSSMPAMAEAARQLIHSLQKSEPGSMRFALMRFDTQAQVDVPFTFDSEAISSGLRNLPEFTGGNQPDAMFAELNALENSLRPDARRIGVFYTDGYICDDDQASINAVERTGNAFKNRGWEFFSVGVPGEESWALMTSLTGSSDRVFHPGTDRDLVRNFGYLGQTILDSAGHQADFGTAFDGRHFKAPLRDLPWRAEQDGRIVRTLPNLPFEKVVLSHPLIPRSGGLWSVGQASGALNYLDANSQPQTLRAPNRPKVLSITWFTLFLAFLPALLWCLTMWPRKMALRQVSDVPVRIPKRRAQVVDLPPLPKHPSPRAHPVPTLFVGLGETGRLTLDGIAWELSQADNGYHSAPYCFLHLDLAAQNQPKPLPFQALEKRRPTVLIPTKAVADVEDYLPSGVVPEYLDWFPCQTYRDRSRSELNLNTEQARTDRVLSRLGLFQWLQAPSLLEGISAQIENLWHFPSENQLRQILVFADWKDGFGSGCAIDLSRILFRINRDFQKGDPHKPIPEIHLVLCDAASDPDHLNRLALNQELQTANLSGAFPQVVTYVPGHKVLDRRDSEAPFHSLFSLETYRDIDLAAQAGELAVVLTERLARSELLANRRRIEVSSAVRFNSHGIHVLPGLLRQKIARDLLLWMLGPDVMLDMAALPDGSYAAEKPGEERTRTLFDEWVLAEPAGSLLYDSLVAARDLKMDSLGERILLRTKASQPESVQEELAGLGSDLESAFLESINQKLFGEATSKGWRRVWSPGEAQALATFFAKKLENLVQEMSANDPSVHLPISILAKSVTQIANALAKWQKDLTTQCTRISRSFAVQNASESILSEISQRSYLQMDGKSPSSRDVHPFGPETCLQDWLKTKDTVSPLLQHLFFEARRWVSSNELVVSLRIVFLEDSRFDDAEAAVLHLEEVAQRLTAGIPLARVSGALECLPEKARKELARGLMQRSDRVLAAMALLPSSQGLPVSESLCLSLFSREIANPADHGRQIQILTADQSAVRRVELSRTDEVGSAKDFLVQRPECIGERVRKRLERIHARQIPFIPPQLRIALADRTRFAAFARAYCLGLIESKVDSQGRQQWFFRDRALTDSANPTLAEAALRFPEVLPTEEEPSVEEATLFQVLTHWIEKGEGDMTDALTLAAAQWVSRNQELEP